MSGDPVHFETGVERSRAELQPSPALWSFSALNEAETCNRRFALTRAHYPDLWAGRGYPATPSLSSLSGSIVHNALEAAVKAMTEAGVPSPQSAEANKVLRDCGGLTEVVGSALRSELELMQVHPRLSVGRRKQIERELRSRVPAFRRRVQSYLSMLEFVPQQQAQVGIRGSSRGSGRRPLTDGSHAEVALSAEELGLRGRVDLLTIQDDDIHIVDYKTGRANENHIEQLRLYALLWSRDDRVNPLGRIATRITASYGDGEVTDHAPSADELLEIEAHTLARVGAAERDLAKFPPKAMPDVEVCRFCTVRQLCEVYWGAEGMRVSPGSAGDWFDIEGVIGARNGTRSWWLERTAGESDLLLRTPNEEPPFSSGDRVRILAVRYDVLPDTLTPVAQLTGTSEVFRMETEA